MAARLSAGIYMPHKLPPLPYPKNALRPHISMETIEYHYGKHHRTYVKKLNKLIAGTRFAKMPLRKIVLSASGETFNNAAQAWNHWFYWQCLSPRGGGQPRGELGKKIKSTFGSFANFKQQFSELAAGTFGSGWVWLVKTKGGRLALVSTGNAENPMTDGKVPLLCCDVWEHAYYIDYRNSRPHYLNAYWKVVNWQFAAANA